MKISKLKIRNYKIFQDITIIMNDSVNIFVGQNDSGKTTILEALTMVLTGKINSGNVANRLSLDWFNVETRKEYKHALEEGETPELPIIEIEVFFCDPADEEIAIKRFKGSNNSLHEDTEGVKLEIVFDSQYCAAYELRFRVVRFEIAPGVFETVYTNLPTDLFPPDELRSLYKMRWGIETSFRELKYAIGLACIHSKQKNSILQEVYARLILYNFTSIMIHMADPPDEDKRINFPDALLFCRRFFHQEPDLLQMIARHVTAIRPGRRYPRYQKHPSCMNLNYRVV